MKRFSPYLISTLIILLMILGVSGAFWYRDTHEYKPIDFTATQPTVRQPPAFRLDDTVTVEALFTNKTDENVTFNAKVYWELKRPQSSSITIIDGRVFQFEFNRVLNPGCTFLSFDNTAPDEVKNISARLFSDGHKTVTWEINGVNRVIEPKHGDEQPFHTQEFTYYRNSIELPVFKERPKLECEKPEL